MLLWIGVPITIVFFLHGADLSSRIWIAPLVAWIAMILGATLAWVWVRYRSRHISWNRSTQGSFILTTMVGNTGYLGYPIVLSLLGSQYFVWALFYDLLGTTLGAYGLGLGIAALFGTAVPNRWQLLGQLCQNPPLWSFVLGLGLRQVLFPPLLEQSLQALAWLVVGLSLVLLGMRLGRLYSWHRFPEALRSLSIKMLLVPLLVAIALSFVGISGPIRLALILQTAMPPALATLVLSEVYELDQDLTVTAIAMGMIGLLITLPLWVWLFD